MIDTKVKLSRHFLVTLIVTVIVFSIAACGRKSVPERPVDSDFPRSYPSQ